jgi:hypothetical protein
VRVRLNGRLVRNPNVSHMRRRRVSIHIPSHHIQHQVVYKMCQARNTDGNNEGGDVHFENAALFLRDALYTRLLTDAVKMGDSGQVVLVLKMLALSFRGNGRTKYAYEMLYLIHHIEHVWPPALRSV